MSGELAWFDYPFYWLGLNSPGMRFLATFTITNTLMLSLKPRFAFTEKGVAKDWSLLSDGDIRTPTTLIPWWLPSLLVGSFCSLFI